MDWDDIQSAYETVCSMSCEPKNTRKVKADYNFCPECGVKIDWLRVGAVD